MYSMFTPLLMTTKSTTLTACGAVDRNLNDTPTVEALIKVPLKNNYDLQRRLVWSVKITLDAWGRL